MIKSTQTLINKNKDNFIIVSQLNKIPHIVSFFKILNNQSFPGLTVDINRYIRCQNLMKTIPTIFKMRSDGDQIEIDVINKVFEFDHDKLSGILNYTILSEDPLIANINEIYEEIEELKTINFIVHPSDEIKNIPKTLKTFPCPCYQGILLSISDTIEKVLHTSILEPNTGLLGITSEEEYKSAITICKMWPELNIKINIKDSNLEIYSDQLKLPDHLVSGIVCLHRNFGNNNITINQTHKLTPSQSPTINYDIIKNDILIVNITNKYNIYYLENINELTNDNNYLESVPLKNPGKLLEKIKGYIKQYNPKHNVKFIL